MPEQQLTFDLPPFARRSETSREAALSVYEQVPRLAARVLRHLELTRGATCAEIETALDLAHQSASARIWELRRAGLIEDSGEKRRTSRGRRAVVWRVRCEK